jgi:signal transduction histidine kinase
LRSRSAHTVIFEVPITSTATRRLARPTFRHDPATLPFVTIAALVAGTLLFLTSSTLRLAIWAPALDIAVHTLGTTVCVTAAGLSYARFREQGGSANLLAAAAFTVLAAANLLNAVVVVTGSDRVFGLSLGDPGQLPLYFWAAVRLFTAALLVAGVSRTVTTALDHVRHPRLFVAFPTIALFGICSALWFGQDLVPVLVDPATLRLLADESFRATALPGVNAGILVLDGIAAVLLAAGAVGYARGPERLGGIARGYLVVGLLIAAFSQVHFVLYPAVFSGLVSTGDALRIAFYVVLLAGVYAASRADLQDLRHANSRLRLLAAAEADRVAIAERARLARELHDGLAQDLWTARLEFDRLAAEWRDPSEDARARLARVRTALVAAGTEARDAVATLRTGFDAGLSLADELPRRIDAFTDQTGYVVDLDVDPRVAELPGVYAAEVVRVVDEALHNVLKHADATRIRVQAVLLADELHVTVEDNGRGFQDVAPADGHGIAGMRERAALLGGALEIRSAPGDGTSIRLVVPQHGPLT